ncbi:hypothetical protein D3C76_987830 [compost metagenome]
MLVGIGLIAQQHRIAGTYEARRTAGHIEFGIQLGIRGHDAQQRPVAVGAGAIDHANGRHLTTGRRGNHHPAFDFAFQQAALALRQAPLKLGQLLALVERQLGKFGAQGRDIVTQRQQRTAQFLATQAHFQHGILLFLQLVAGHIVLTLQVGIARGNTLGQPQALAADVHLRDDFLLLAFQHRQASALALQLLQVQRAGGSDFVCQAVVTALDQAADGDVRTTGLGVQVTAQRHQRSARGNGLPLGCGKVLDNSRLWRKYLDQATLGHQHAGHGGAAGIGGAGQKHNQQHAEQQRSKCRPAQGHGRHQQHTAQLLVTPCMHGFAPE